MLILFLEKSTILLCPLIVRQTPFPVKTEQLSTNVKDRRLLIAQPIGIGQHETAKLFYAVKNAFIICPPIHCLPNQSIPQATAGSNTS